jgi:hypothetical protein
MLYARWKNDDVASRVILCALVGSALAIPLKYDNHLLGLVKVPRHSHPWAEDVFMYVRVRAGHRHAHILDTTTRSLTAAGKAIQSIPARHCKNMASLPVPEFVSWCSLVSAPAKTFSPNQDPQLTWADHFIECSTSR